MHCTGTVQEGGRGLLICCKVREFVLSFAAKSDNKDEDRRDEC